MTDDQFDALSERIYLRRFTPETVLFHQGAPATAVYIIETGRVRLYGVGLHGQEHTLNIFGPRDIFGEVSVLDGKPRSGSAVAMTHADLWIIQKDDLDLFLEQYPSIARAMNSILASRLRLAARHIETMIFQDVLGRLAYELITLAELHGEHVPEGRRLLMPLTQSDLASIVGTTRESINKAIGALRAHNLVHIDGLMVTVLDTDGLWRVFEERAR